jgi:hypothetical protein
MQIAGTTEFAQRRPSPVDLWDVTGAIVLTFFVIAVFCAQDAKLLHWFLGPLSVCGVLVGIDAVRWLRSKMDTLDPKGILALLGIHFFVVAPMLVVTYDFPSVDQVYITDWRDWLGYMGVLNSVGLVLYLLTQHWAYGHAAKPARRFRALKQSTASIVVPVVLLASVVAHAIYLIRVGGIQTLVDIRTYGLANVQVDAGGFGPFAVAGRAIPILCLLVLTIWRFRRQARAASLFVPGVLLVLVLALQMMVSGAAGSRSDTAYQLLWSLGVVHLLWHRITIKWIGIGLIPFCMFMYLYTFYKEVGSRSFGILTGTESIAALKYDTKRTFVGMLVGDLSRADVQAAQFCALVDKRWDYRYRWGHTYLSACYFLVPRTIWPSKPSDSEKVVAGTELLSGPGSYASKGEIIMYGTGTRSTRIYGLAGEAMLNYGPWSAPLAFAVLGIVMARIRRRMQSYRVGDARLFLAPFYVVVLLLLLSHDMDNLVMQVLFNVVVPAITIYVASYWVPIDAQAMSAWEPSVRSPAATARPGSLPQPAVR